jgi:hypothetical protein
MSSDLALELIRGDSQRELKWWGKQITSYFGNYVIISHLMQDLLALRIYQSHDIHLLSIMSRMCISGVCIFRTFLNKEGRIHHSIISMPGQFWIR